MGRLTHSWQDYFAHAVLLNGNAGPAWAANPPITGSPDSLNDKLKPASWGGYTDTGEHGWSELASRDKLGGEQRRYDDARQFVRKKLKSLISDWRSKCVCYCQDK